MQQYVGGSTVNAAAPLASSQATAHQTTQTVPATITVPPPTTQPTPTPAPIKPAPVPSPEPVTAAPLVKPKGEYIDGTYTGNAADAFYGYIQVQVTIQVGTLTDVTFLQYPNDRSTSRHINEQAMPYLKSEAIQAQSANVSGVSGATDTSQAFVESLGHALSQAKNS
jgi:uncharacterized protein with FMN-binding domain